MRIAVVSGTEKKDVAQMMCALKSLGHNVISLSLVHKGGIFPLKTEKIEAIVGIGFNNSGLSLKLHMMADFARIPIINLDWCYRNLSKLLNVERNQRSQQY